MNTLWLVVGMLAAGVAWGAAVYNGLVARRQRTNQAFADIDVQLKQRHDLVPGLVQVVKGYAAHEKEVLEAVIRARSAAMAAPQGSAGQASAESSLGKALGRLIAVSEAYPDLKANDGFRHLQGELSDIENKLASARRFLNNAVGDYNAAIESFPAVLIARRFGFAPRAFFDLGDSDRKALDAPRTLEL